MNTTKKHFLSLTLFFMLFSNCFAETQDLSPAEAEQTENQIPKLPLNSILKELSIDLLEVESSALILGCLGTIAHEWGHAGAGATMFSLNRTPTISIGTTTPDKDASLLWFSIGNMNFYKKLPFSGLTQFNANFYKDDPLLREKWIIFCGAGGIAGAAFLYSILTNIMAYCSYCDGKSLGKIIDTSCRRALSPFTSILQTKNLSFQQKRFLINLTFVASYIIAFQLIYGLFPLLDGGDGTEIWADHLGFSDKTISILKPITAVGLAGCLGLIVYHYYQARKTLAKQRTDGLSITPSDHENLVNLS